MTPPEFTAAHGTAHFDDQAWPHPGRALDDLEWLLRNDSAASSPAARDLMVAAATIVAAYRALVALPERERRVVVRVLRAAARHDAPAEGK